ncbi:unnamed protein product [Leptosia nina]|uniref:MICOS complex subunit MIC10 n=1 Tax=Leptosia nina TaxID=320188 RepID=A0AAV1JTS2_9NEOP
MTKSKQGNAEEDYSAKLDKCLTDGIVKTGGGIVLGALTSVLFFKRRRWPVIAGMEECSLKDLDRLMCNIKFVV